MIVKPIEAKEEILKKSNLIVPATANADLESGSVIKTDKAIDEYIKVGDTVIYAKGAGQGQLINGEPHVWIAINEIWGSFNSPLSVAKD